MKVPRFRIAWVMAFVALAALNFTVVRATLNAPGIISELLAVGAMPMATVLAIGLLIGYRRPGSRPFLLGFESFGAMALAFYIALASCFDDEAVTPYLGLLLDPIAKAIGTRP